jgi:hypothetical protein
MVKLFDIQNGRVIPTEHCYTLKTLKDVIDSYEFEQEYLKVFQYIFYMSCPNPDLNPFFDVREHEKEAMIVKELDVNFSLEDDVVLNALRFCEKLYDTPTKRAYVGIKTMLDRLATYMETTAITHGRDGNITAIVNTAAKFQQIRASFKDTYKDLMDEQKSVVRGKERLAYDQM